MAQALKVEAKSQGEKCDRHRTNFIQMPSARSILRAYPKSPTVILSAAKDLTEC
jgi:hypothetical protein